MAASDTSTPEPRRVSLSVTRALPLVFGLIVALAFLPVALISLFAVRDNTGRLLRDGQEAILDTLTEKVRSHLDQVVAQMAYAEGAIRGGIIDPRDGEAFRRFMTGLLGATPQVAGIGFLTIDGPFVRYERATQSAIEEPRSQAPLADTIIATARAGGGPWWGPPFVSLIRQRPTILYFKPVRRDGALLGVFMVAVANEDLADYLARSAEVRTIEPFILAGRERVLVHRNLDRFDPNRPTLPGLGEVGDPVLARIWTDMRAHGVHFPMLRSQSHWTRIDGVGHGYFFREVRGYGDTPWIVGFHEPESRTFRERAIVQGLMWLVPILLVVSVAIAWFVAHVLARRVRAVASEAADIEALDFAARPPPRPSRLTELDDTARALTRAKAALRRFEAYVPRGLVRSLMTLGAHASEPRDADVTVMFLDLAGYSAMARGRSAAEVGAYLNGVFAAVGPIVEAHGGTIDKYTGDGLLAVWGAPTPEPDHAARAIRAAREIARVMTPMIADARAAGEPVCRIRIGLHAGRVVAGDLGYEGRTDYTVVGRTVNVAQRVQASLKSIADAPDVVVGATAITLRAGGAEVPARATGESVDGEAVLVVDPPAIAETRPPALERAS